MFHGGLVGTGLSHYRNTSTDLNQIVNLQFYTVDDVYVLLYIYYMQAIIIV